MIDGLQKTVNLSEAATQREDQKLVVRTDLSLNAGQEYCRIRPSLSYHLSLRSLFCLFFDLPLTTG